MGGRLQALDLGTAAVVAPPGMPAVEKKAIALLLDEVEKRSGIRWTIAPGALGQVVRVLNSGGGPREGYEIRSDANEVRIAGNDSRGVLFGVGRLLRELRMRPGSVSLPDGFRAAGAPKYPLRGHQLGYRPKTNSYDGWTLAMWEQYIRDLAVFGTNAIELIPPRSDDDDQSPHFPLPKMETMIGMSRICDDYGLDVWIWYPALDEDYSKPETMEFALNEWAEVFRKLPRIDAVFVPGGDPGHTHPKHLMPLLEKQAASLRRYHPKAQLWVAPQGFSAEWLEEFYAILRGEPEWLAGVVFGPQIRASLPELRAAVPKKYPIRHYPDITHSLHCQYPVPDWDLAYAWTLGREPINPRPVDQSIVFRLLQPYTIGFIAYSEGCNDDVNKIVWSALGWDPDTDLGATLREYGRYFIGPEFEEGFAQGLFALERNWRGPLLTNEGAFATLRQFQALERQAAPRDLLNWRFQQALYRAYYDAYTRSRLIYETVLEDRALEALERGGAAALDEAERILSRAETEPVAQAWRSRVFELAEALFQSIRMQLSVPRYQAIGLRRGANLDAIDAPLNNRGWLAARIAEIRRLPGDAERRRATDEIVRWSDPAPGGFYDDLGNPAVQPHVVRRKTYSEDPAHLESPLVSFATQGQSTSPLRTSWKRHLTSLYDQPLEMRYANLSPSARYRVRITYAGEPAPARVRLVADGRWEVHSWRRKDFPIRPVEFAIPPEATADGELTLTWTKEAGGGGAGRGLEVAEVWLFPE
ncbi:MAG: hypothetical protein KIT09_06300 [Bryobacteraceae bacterium]|nr:hypothetical protein [Bryobacteraceae bacterium]